MGQKYRDESWLRKKYVEEDFTQAEIAKKCDVSRSTIGKWVRKFDIKKFTPPYHTISSSNGYEVVQTNACNERCSVKIHRLIAIAEHGFSSVINKDIHHENNMKIDNRVENLKIEEHEEHGRISAEKRWE